MSDLPRAAAETERLEALVRDHYERCHPDDTFADLKRRARFAKEDKGLLADWMALAERRAREGAATPPRKAA
jgi:hypothetical protein